MSHLMPSLSGDVSRILLFLKAVRYGRHEEILPELLLTVKNLSFAPGGPCATIALRTSLQLVAHTQHSPLPILHWPTDEVTVQGADTLVSKSPAAQSQVSPHTATVWSAAHTQHSPLPTVQLPVSDCTAHGADSLATSDAAPQLQVSPHTATVGICATWRHTSGCSCPSSPPRASCASAGTASTRISQGSAHGIFRYCFCIMALQEQTP